MKLGSRQLLLPAALIVLAAAMAQAAEDDVTLNAKADGYRGIWYFNQKSNDQYVYKYSGGLGTYCAKHQPFAVYRPEVDKTFFCYGGTSTDSYRELLHMVSYYDHRTGTVPQPTILLDKQTDDAHDNPVISVDDDGHVWIFSTSHGRGRPSYVHRSTRPYDIDQFERVRATYRSGDQDLPLDNFSYMQVWYVPRQGFVSFFTRYSDPAPRTSMFMTSQDGVRWSQWQRLAAIQEGHYQISTVGRGKAAAAFNFHPAGRGLNWRTNLYYMETTDGGRSWHSVGGQLLDLPLTEPANPALVHDYQQAGLNVYLKDIRLDQQGRPIILYLTSRGYESGPNNDPRTWRIARWTGSQWSLRTIATSDNNYDMGSLYLEADGTWRVIAPTDAGPQPYNPGGQMVMWTSQDEGQTWTRSPVLTSGPRNHTYARRPVDAAAGFYALWADGHARQPSRSQLYFCDREGSVSLLPPLMETQSARPVKQP